jgi:hypothetical protein
MKLAAWFEAWTAFARSSKDRGFESHWRHGCLCALVCVCVVLYEGSGLARAHPPSKESYRLYIGLEKLKRRTRSNKRDIEPNKERIYEIPALLSKNKQLFPSACSSGNYKPSLQSLATYFLSL